MAALIDAHVGVIVGLNVVGMGFLVATTNAGGGTSGGIDIGGGGDGGGL